MYVGKHEKFSNFLKDKRIVFLGSKDGYSSCSLSESELMYMYMIIDNYGPKSILPSISKILKKVVYRQLMAHLNWNGMHSQFQYGLLRNRSTELVVTHFTDAIRKQAGNGNLTGCEFIDLSGMVH